VYSEASETKSWRNSREFALLWTEKVFMSTLKLNIRWIQFSNVAELHKQ
jgi:hypothetical protein